MVPIDLGADWEAQVAQLCGFDPDSVDAGSVTVALVNPNGVTTVRATVRMNVPTDQLAALTVAALPHG